MARKHGLRPSRGMSHPIPLHPPRIISAPEDSGHDNHQDADTRLRAPHKPIPRTPPYCGVITSPFIILLEGCRLFRCGLSGLGELEDQALALGVHM